MKTPTMSYQLYNQDLMDDFSGASVGMEVDDGDPLEILGAAAEFENKHQPPPIDADFFNSFEDDFDDSDVAWSIGMVSSYGKLGFVVLVPFLLELGFRLRKTSWICCFLNWMFGLWIKIKYLCYGIKLWWMTLFLYLINVILDLLLCFDFECLDCD